MKKWMLITAALALSGCSRQEPAAEAKGGPKAAPPAEVRGVIEIPSDSPKLNQIRIEKAEAADVPTDEVVSPGKIEVNPNRVSRIALPVAGRITSVLVRLGDQVEQGQQLLAIESPDADAAASQQLQAEASLTQAKANLVKAQSDHDRLQDLFEHNAVARKELLNADNALVQAKASVEQAEASREQAIRRLTLLGLAPKGFGQKVAVRAPLAGKVLDLVVAAGEYRNDTNQPLITIADLSTVWVASDVPESAIRLIQIGEQVDVLLDAYPGEDFRAKVTRIADTVDPQTRTIKVRAELDNRRGRLRPEMFGSIRHIEGTRRLTVVPAGAVLQVDGKSIVIVETAPGKFRQTEVATGKRLGDSIPILRGIQTGDRVVSDGAMLLKQQ